MTDIEPGAKPPKYSVQITLQRDGIVAPLTRILADTVSNVTIGLDSIASYANSSPRMPVGYVPYTFETPHIAQQLSESDLEERRAKFRLWLLTRGFEECSKALLACLREAYLYIEMVNLDWSAVPTVGDLQERVDAIRKASSRRNFPQLLEHVTMVASEPVLLAEHVVSINKVRNCLEHRQGIVQPIDTTAESGESLILKWKEMRIVLNIDGKEVEFQQGLRVEAPEGADHATITGTALLALDNSRSFPLGARVELSAAEFNYVVYTCHLFAQEVARNLPKPPEGNLVPGDS